MLRLARLACLAALLALPSLVATSPAQAIEVKCIEASKYKYIWTLFDNDPRKFAAYLQVDPANLPSPEFCRAALLTGSISAKDETPKLVSFILANRGWLATLFLNSPGGAIGQGVELSIVTRMFWLKTRAAFSRPIAYEPDFLLPPPAGWAPKTPPEKPDTSANALVVIPGWPKFQQATKGLPQPEEGNGSTSCASSCSMIFVSGADRNGIVRLHRPRSAAFEEDPNVTLSSTIDRLQGSERFQVALFDKMDAGEAFIRTYRTTPTNITQPATTLRTPPYVSDIMLKSCKSDAAQLEDLDSQTRAAIGYINRFGEGFVPTEPLRRALRQIYERREVVEACVAVLHERERLKRYAEVCRQGCAFQDVMSQVQEQYQQIRARGTPPKADPAQPGVSRQQRSGR